MLQLLINADYIICPYHYDLNTIDSTRAFILAVFRLRQTHPQIKAQFIFVCNKYDVRVGKGSEFKAWKIVDEYFQKFGEECQRRWTITPLQIFLHKDEGHWLNGQPDAEDKENFQVGERWFKPNYHAHIVFDWMNHDTGKSRKLNDDDMMQMQTLASDILLLEREQSKAVTGKEHLERNDFIIEKQKAELQRIDETKR